MAQEFPASPGLGASDDLDCSPGPGLLEAILIGALFAVMTLGVLLTYATHEPDELYHVSRDGLAGGLSRALVYLNYPAALAAVAILGVVAQQNRDTSPAESRFTRRRITWGCVAAAVLCLVVGLPGVVKQSDLDAKLVNVIPAAGIVLTALFVAVLARRNGIGDVGPLSRPDRIRVAISALLIAISLPWFFAEFGIFIDDIPGLSRIFVASELLPPGATHAAVHLGDHHGLSGGLFALSGLWISRTLPRSRPSRLRSLLSGYLALLLTYGLGNFANDAWLEQIVKRGWLDWKIPSVTTPALSIAWGVVVAAAVAVEMLWFRPERRAVSG